MRIKPINIFIVAAAVLACALCWLTGAWGATWYVSPAGGGSTCSLASPCAIAGGLAKLDGAANTLCFLEGTYTSTTTIVTINSANHANTTLTGCDEAGNPSESVRDTVILNLNNTDANAKVIVTHTLVVDNLVFKNMTARSNNNTQAPITLSMSTTNVRVENMRIAQTGTSSTIYVAGGPTGLRFTRNIIQAATSAISTNHRPVTIGVSAGSSVTFDHNILMPLETANMFGGYVYDGSGAAAHTVNWINNIHLGQANTGIYIGSAGATWNVNNNIFATGWLFTTAYDVVCNACTAVNSNNNWYGGGIYSFHYISGASLGANDRAGGYAKLGSYPLAPGYIMLCIDDTYSSESVDWMLSNIPAGMTFTWFVPGYDVGSGKNFSYADLQAYYTAENTAKMEIGVHTYSHQTVTNTDGGTLSVSGAECTTPEYKVDRAAGTFSVRSAANAGAAYDQDYNQDFSAIVAALSAADPTCAWTHTTGADTAKANIWGSIFADTGGFIATTTAMAYLTTDSDCTDGDCPGRHYAEIVKPKEVLEAALSGYTDSQTGMAYQANSYGAAQSGEFDAALHQALRTAGYQNARGRGGDAKYFTANLNVYNHSYVYTQANYFNGLTYPYDATEEATARVRIRAHAEMMAMTGGIIFYVFHGELGDGAAERLTARAQAAILFDEWAYFHSAGLVKVMSAQKMIADIKTRGTYNSSTGILTTTFSAPAPTLSASSLLINAGTPVTGVHPGTDYLGNPNDIGGPDIGAYEYQNPHNIVGTSSSGVSRQ